MLHNNCIERVYIKVIKYQGARVSLTTHLTVLRSCVSFQSLSLLVSIDHPLSLLSQDHQSQHGQSCKSDGDTPLGVVSDSPPEYRRHTVHLHEQQY